MYLCISGRGAVFVNVYYFHSDFPDTTRPLKTTQQEEDQYSLMLPFSYPSAAVVDVSDNLRSKLYGMFYRIGV